MARKAIYHSRFSPGKKVSIFHLILEIVCENKAKKENKDLPAFFWRLASWEKFYKSQLRAVSKLCKKHGDEKVYSFVKKSRIYNLLGKQIDKWLTDYKLSEVVVLPQKPEEVKPVVFNKTTKIKGLKGLL